MELSSIGPALAGGAQIRAGGAQVEAVGGPRAPPPYFNHWLLENNANYTLVTDRHSALQYMPTARAAASWQVCTWSLDTQNYSYYRHILLMQDRCGDLSVNFF